ncbi:MAG TPA: HIT family protein [Candidatus Saccharimonadales bacterium]|nr:HIT family protein [Candidatus Saccharimonadales bacterium]
MSVYRSRKENNIYNRYRDQNNKNGCQFCEIGEGDKQYVAESKSFKVIRNIFAYSVWDGQRVTDHLMIVPKKHIDNLGSLTPAQSSEFLKLIDKYESQGYNIYARAPASKIKTVVHQHTHLIKSEGEHLNLLFVMHKPFYLRIPR